MWAVIITNQGYPVQLTLVDSKDQLEDTVKTAVSEWNVTEELQTQVISKPVFGGAPSPAITKSVTLRVDRKKRPNYTLSIIANLKTARRPRAQKRWQFCPECGCSWLSHLEGQASLDVEDWDPRPCTECGCDKAVKL